jgi:TolB-like protein/DNA-binding winged helix-turn-helix (wHTH) protein/Flp pilus assembly protein TadD
MDPLSSKPSLLRFGIFEVDLKTSELRKAGMKQKLSPQPFQVLQALLERPGEVVTREQLRDVLWPDHTFVDYDLALKKAINRLRDVLGDSADAPRFIETIPRQGYRFLAEVQAVDSSGPRPTADVRVHWKLVVGLACAIATALLLGFNVGKLRTRIFAYSRPSEIRSIAVLPLENLSHDPNQEYFADGMTDALITDLAQIGSLKVISRTSSMQYKQLKKPLQEIARELNVDGIVEGTVQRSGDRVRITGQLIDATNDRHLWARSYERNLKDVLALQDEVARDIAEEIRIKLGPQERARLTEARAVNPESHESYLKGRYFYERLSVQGFKEGLSYYQQAVKLDPSYAPAYVGVAASYKELGVWGVLPPREAAASSSEAVQKALALDNASGDAHAVLGHIHFLWDWDWAGAEREYRRAMELEPPSTDTRIQYAVYLSAMARHDDAVAVMREARTLDPVSQPANGLLGDVYYWAHRFDEAIDQFRKDIALRPDSPFDHFSLGLCYERKGMYPEAIEEYLKAKELDGAARETLATFRKAFVKSGRKGFLREELKSAIASSKDHYASPSWIAQLCARLDDKDQALQWLERAYQERNHNLALINTEPMLDNLHSDPRFQDLLRRMNFPQ